MSKHRIWGFGSWGKFHRVILVGLFSVMALVRGQAWGQVNQPATEPSKLPRVLTEADKVVDAGQSAGLLNTVCPSTAEIDLHWPDVPHTGGYWVFRSETPKITLGWGASMLVQTNDNKCLDNNVVAGKRYYYAIISMPDRADGKAMLAATGSCAALGKDEPLVGIYTQPEPTLPSTKLNVSDFVPREVFDEVASDRDDKASQLAQAQQEVEKLKAEVAAMKTGQK